MGEREIFLRDVMPELKKMIADGVIRPRMLIADAGFSGNEISVALHRLGIQPRIDVMDRTSRWTGDEIQGGVARVSLLVRGHLARRLGYVYRTHDRYGKELKEPKREVLWDRLPIRRIDQERLRVGYGCRAEIPPKLLDMLKVETDRKRAQTYFPCGARHTDKDPCRADAQGVIFWVTVTGPDLDTTVVTRARPARGDGFKPTENVYFEIGPRASQRRVNDARGGKRHGKRRDLAGLYRTPLTPRDHPNVSADFRRARSCIERRNGILHRYSSLTVAPGWKTVAAWWGYMAVLCLFILALSNMERLAERDRRRRLTDEEREGRLCLVAGYVVSRVRAHKKRVAPPATESPPRAA